MEGHMISVNLTGQNNLMVTATIYGDGTDSQVAPFISFDIGPLNVIVASAEQARKLAGALHRAADKLDGLPTFTPPDAAPVADEGIPF
jgi:hypothetical protein